MKFLTLILRKTVAELLDSAGRIRFTHFCAELFAFCSRLEAASVVISGRFVKLIVPDKSVKYGDPRQNRSGVGGQRYIGSVCDSPQDPTLCQPTPDDI